MIIVRRQSALRTIWSAACCQIAFRSTWPGSARQNLLPHLLIRSPYRRAIYSLVIYDRGFRKKLYGRRFAVGRLLKREFNGQLQVSVGERLESD